MKARHPILGDKALDPLVRGMPQLEISLGGMRDSRGQVRLKDGPLASAQTWARSMRRIGLSIGRLRKNSDF